MLIYSANKSEFVQDSLNDKVVDKIISTLQENRMGVSSNEVKSWDDSMVYMYRLISNSNLPEDAGIAIEYKIPVTSKRIDFMISGYDEEGNPQIIIIELKGWEKAFEVMQKDGLVKDVLTYLGKGERETSHPSYQAWSYANILENSNENINEQKMNLLPCAFLYRFDKNFEKEIRSEKYKTYLEKAPIYLKGDTLNLADFISKNIKKGDLSKNIFEIENSKIRPSKSLQDALSGMIKGNQEFVLIDDQKVVCENILHLGKNSFEDDKKRVVIVEGGPGTGKSVVAINLLTEFNKEGKFARYISRNQTPRSVYSKKLKGEKKNTEIDFLFSGSGSYHNALENSVPALIVDEAHRLNEKSGMFKHLGENQIKEIINASKFSVFFIDENQKVTMDDIGSKDEILKFAEEKGAEVTNLKLESQFRCSGSDGYLAWLDDVLGIRDTANFDGFNEEYDIKIFDDVVELRDEIFRKNKENNKSRLVAGYCWNWDKEGRNNSNQYDIEIGDFKMSWNLGNTSTWAIDETSVNEVGCIHTCQGLEFDYVGVIIGDDLRYENGEVITDFSKRAKTDHSLRGIKKMYNQNPEKAKEVADKIIRNTYRTLMSRGQKGCYIYCTDKALSDYLKSRLEFSEEAKEYPVGEIESSELEVAERKRK